MLSLILYTQWRAETCLILQKLAFSPAMMPSIKGAPTTHYG
jgi:hypothetical protein